MIPNLMIRNTISDKKIIFNQAHESPGNVTNFVLVVKYYVCKRRCAGLPLDVQAFEYELQYIKNMEKYNAIVNYRLDKHTAKWENIRVRASNEINKATHDAFVNGYLDTMELQ